MISPAILQSLNTVRVKLWAYSYSTYPIKVGVMSDPTNASSFVEIASYATSSTWTERVVDFNSYVGSGVYVALKFVGTSTYQGVYVDDITIEALPSCLEPTLQTVSNKNSVGADLGWTSPDSFFDIFIQSAATPAPDGLTTPTADNVSGNSYTWADGSPATPYYWWVRTDCDAGGGAGVSTWTGPNSFTTLLCDPVDQCNYTFRMTDAYGDGWNGNTMAVKQGGITVQTLAHTTTGTAPVDVLVGLCDGNGFELFWNTGGTYPEEVGIEILDAFGNSIYYRGPGSGAQNTSLYTGTTNCTPPACAKPTAQIVSDINVSGADLSWTSSTSFLISIL
ncbi:MAG: hypothetical protein IPF68_16810 [Bacteroidales bacterium]|nr:hypothetical protein [Bacteroidales bacterium]